jgi:hypothetical protein
MESLPPLPGHFSNNNNVVHVNDDDNDNDDIVHVDDNDDVVHVNNNDIVQVQDSDCNDLPVGQSSSGCGDADSLVGVCVMSAVTRTHFDFDLDGHCSCCQCRAACIGEDRG